MSSETSQRTDELRPITRIVKDIMAMQQEAFDIRLLETTSILPKVEIWSCLSHLHFALLLFSVVTATPLAFAVHADLSSSTGARTDSLLRATYSTVVECTRLEPSV